MKVSELKVGELYKIRSDRETHVTIRHNYLDVHLGYGHFTADSKVRPFDHIIYLGKDLHGDRKIIYRGQELRAYPNIWQHIVPIDHDNP